MQDALKLLISAYKISKKVAIKRGVIKKNFRQNLPFNFGFSITIFTVNKVGEGEENFFSQILKLIT